MAIKLFCDRCGKEKLETFVISIHNASNPYPRGYSDNSHGVGVCSEAHKTFMLCQDCYKHYGLPNIYKDNDRFDKDLKK